MKRNMLRMGALISLSALLIFASCKKEETTVQFTGTIEQCADDQGKTTFSASGDAYNIHWASGDQVVVYDATPTNATYNVTPDSEDPTIGRFGGSALLENAPYTAIYPASIAVSSTTVNLPIAQTCDANGYPTSYPMYATSSEMRLPFKNLCGLMKLNLQGDGITLSAIHLITNSYVNGDFTVSTDEYGIPTLTAVDNTTNGKAITLNMPEGGISINTAHDFYICLPAGNYSNFTLTLVTSDGRYWTKTTNTTGVVSIVRSQYSTITIDGIDDDLIAQGALPGLIPVSSTEKVRFSKGNLQCYMNNGSITSWRFAEHQYEFVGGLWEYNGNSVDYGMVYENGVKCTNLGILNSNYTGWIDLFAWSDNNSNYGLSTSTNNDDYNGSQFVDWGHNAITNGGNQTDLWHTPSEAEFTHIFGRSTSTRLYARILVDNVAISIGQFILPDNWKSPFKSNHGTGYTLEELAQMEAAGAVLLPYAGNRWGSDFLLGSGPSASSITGYYRSSTITEIQYLTGSTRGNHSIPNGGPGGYSVRLILGAPASSSK